MLLLLQPSAAAAEHVFSTVLMIDKHPHYKTIIIKTSNMTNFDMKNLTLSTIEDLKCTLLCFCDSPHSQGSVAKTNGFKVFS